MKLSNYLEKGKTKLLNGDKIAFVKAIERLLEIGDLTEKSEVKLETIGIINRMIREVRNEISIHDFIESTLPESELVFTS